MIRHGDIGTVKAAIKTLILGPDFDRALSDVEARFTDGLHLQRVPEAQVKTAEITGAYPAFPFLEMVAGRSVFDPETQEEGRAEHALLLIWWADADDEETATALVERFTLATRTMLLAGYESALLTPLAAAFPVRLVREDLSPLTFRKPEMSRAWVKAKSLEIVVPTHDREG